MAVDARNGGVEAQKWSPGAVVADSRHFDEDPDPHYSRIRIRIQVISWIRTESA
jgi:hypothetical protein